MGYGGLVIIFFMIIAIFAGMLLGGLGFIVYAIVNYLKNGKQFKNKTKNKLILGIGLAAMPLLVLVFIGIFQIKENVKNSRDLFYQANIGTVEGMRKILDSGVPADCQGCDNFGKNIIADDVDITILGYLVIHYNDQRNEHKQYGEKIQLLIDYGADVNRKMGYGTPLLFAVDGRNSDVTELLLKNGADVNARYSDGQTALQKLNKDIDYYGPDGYRYDEDFYNKLLKVRAVLLKYGAK